MNKKGISAVIAISLLVIVAVISVMSLNIFYSSFQSKINTRIELQDTQQDTSIENIIGNNLFLKNPNKDNITLQKIIVNGIDCNILPQNVSSGIKNLDLSTCLTHIDSGITDISIITDKDITTKKILYKNQNSVYTNLNNITDNDGDGYLWVGISNYNAYFGVDCDDTNPSITFAVDGSCDNDGDGIIDFSAGGNDRCDNNLLSTCPLVDVNLNTHADFNSWFKEQGTSVIDYDSTYGFWDSDTNWDCDTNFNYIDNISYMTGLSGWITGNYGGSCLGYVSLSIIYDNSSTFIIIYLSDANTANTNGQSYGFNGNQIYSGSLINENLRFFNFTLSEDKRNDINQIKFCSKRYLGYCHNIHYIKNLTFYQADIYN